MSETQNKILHGDCLERLKDLADNSIDLVCTDPPYGYSFMGKAWDKALPSVDIWKEILRVLKPGGFAFVMSAPRSDVCSRMSLRLEEAGFKIDFTPIYWTYASGFPKAMNMAKAIDKRNGVEFETKPAEGVGFMNSDTEDGYHETKNQMIRVGEMSDQAKALDGSYGGFQLKPAVEVIIVAMKPLSEKTYVDQALKNGKGITWLDDARIPTEENLNGGAYSGGERSDGDWKESSGFKNDKLEDFVQPQGRFPANLLVSDDILSDHSRFFSLDKWAETLPFLAVPKASKSEKNRGLEKEEPKKANYLEYRPNGESTQGLKTPFAGTNRNGTMKNNHPTVKPLKLMSYLISLGSRPNDIVLDPFCGSGTTCIAAKELGRNYIGIEREAEYIEIANARINTVSNQLTII